MIDPDFRFRLLTELSDDWVSLHAAHFCFVQAVGNSRASDSAFIVQILAMMEDGSICYGDIGDRGDFIISAKSRAAIATEIQERLAAGDTRDHAWFDLTPAGLAQLEERPQKSDLD